MQIKEIIFILLLCLAITGIIAAIVPDIFYLRAIETKWLLTHAGTHGFVFNPRFWIQGWL
jgi:hypothetical protein